MITLLDISYVHIFSAHRSNNFIVGLTDVSPATTAPTLWNYTVCAQYPGAVGDGATVHLPCTSCMPPRRYLIVQIEHTASPLNFCEIEVFVRGKSIFVLSYKQTNRVIKADNRPTTGKITALQHK